MKESISLFFDDYTTRFNRILKGETPEDSGIAHCFADCWLAAMPGHLTCCKSDAESQAILAGSYAFYRSTGMISARIGSKTITLLDQHHALVKIHWQSLFEHPEGRREEVGADAHYLVQVNETQVLLIAAITANEPQLLAAKGLSPYR